MSPTGSSRPTTLGPAATRATAASLDGFRNEPLLELRRPEVRDAALAALARLDARLPVRVPIRIDGEELRGEEFERVDAGEIDRVVTVAQAASARHAAAAIGCAAGRGQREWGARSASERATVLRRAADILHAERLDLAALAVREVAKPWAEADADVCEAIDFLRYYAAGALDLDRGAALAQLPGERNDLRYVPRGVTIVIAPWNFPFAIACGMTSAALATGNPVVVKPAEQSPACADAIVRALHAAGVPVDALALLPGGDDPGKALVADPRGRTIAFTGSVAAGTSIIERAAASDPERRGVVRVLAEMGGKNCVLVDSDADLDDAVPAIVRSAFGFAGQKCSAASRVIVHERVADALEERLAGAIAALRVGPAEDFATDVPPVVDPEAQGRLLAALAAGRASARATHEAPGVPPDGWSVTPTLLGGLPPGHDVVERELFGPVLALEAVTDMDVACEIVDGLPYALTAGLFARSPRTIDAVAARLPVGNLYVNRDTTGARVGHQPFGGTRLSGTGPKAGGPDYLLAFVDARCITENTIRHGLVV